jgi:hypothetical protein
MIDKQQTQITHQPDVISSLLQARRAALGGER